MDLKGRNFLTLKDFTPEEIGYFIELAEKLIENTGYENISLSSLSSCDYSDLYL